MATGTWITLIDSGCSLEKELTKLICMYPWMILYLISGHVDSCHDCANGPFDLIHPKTSYGYMVIF